MINFLDDTFLLEDYSCEGTRWFPIFQTAKFVIRVIQIAVPFALVIWGSLDWFKALIAHDEKEMRIKRKPFIARVVAALIVFFLPWFVEFISKQLAGKKKTADFWTCYAEAKAIIDFKGYELEPRDDDDYGLHYTPGSSGSGSGSGSGSDSGSGSGSSESKKYACSNYKTEAECAKGSSTHSCLWVEKQVSSNSSIGYCINGEKNKLTCDQYGANNGKTCPTTDDYDNPCYITEPECPQCKSGCDYKKNPKTCEDHGSAIPKSSCPKKDDWGKTCTWETKNGSTGTCKRSN